MKKLVSVLLCIMLAAAMVTGCGSSDAGSGTGDKKTKETKETGEEKTADPEEYQVVMVVKQSDSWFDDMATGVEQLKKDTGLNVSVQVPETGDAASQISIMEDLIAQGGRCDLRSSK